MTNVAQEYIDRIRNKGKLTYLDLSNQELADEMNLVEFTNLTSINAYKNNFTNFNWIFTLPNKQKLKKINLWGNKITNLGDISRLFDEFPRLESVNIGGNSLKWSELDNLEDQQALKLIRLVKEEKIKITASEADSLNYIGKLKEENISLKQQISDLQGQAQIVQQLQQVHLPRNNN